MYFFLSGYYILIAENYDSVKINRKLQRISQERINPKNFDYQMQILNEIKYLKEFRNFDEIEWNSLGPFSPTNDFKEPLYNGNGRINDIEIDPFDSLNIWIGSASGGLWKSSDKGNKWEIIQELDYLSLGIADIEFSKINRGEIYIATGDPYSQVRYYSFGLLKSTDYGETWENIYQFNISNKTVINDIELIEELNIILAATSKGLQVSFDNGKSWKAIINDIPINDIEIFRGDTVRIFLATYDFYKGNSFILSSEDSAKSFQIKREYELVENIEIAVNNKSKTIFAISSDLYNHQMLDLVYSSDFGNTWVTIADSSSRIDLVEKQGFYNLVLESNPDNPNEIIAGGINLYKSIDFGKSWYLQYGLHVDQHDVIYDSNGKIFNANDGGIYVNNSTNDWINLSNGLNITQIYGFSVHPLNPSIVNIGTQDNGLQKFNYSNFEYIAVGDGMKSAYDMNDLSVIYYLLPRGNILQLQNDIPKIISITEPERKPWSADVFYSDNQEMVYTGTINLYNKSTYDKSWLKLTDFKDTLEITSIAESRDTLFFSKQNLLYFYYNNQSYLLREFDNVINKIFINKELNQLILGFECLDCEKNLLILDQNNIINISKDLPKIPINDIEIIEEKILVASDAGIYIYDQDSWSYYGNKFPPAIVTQVDYNSEFKILTASTFGRGIWQAKLSDCITEKPIIEISDDKFCFEDTVKLSVINPIEGTEYRWYDGTIGKTKSYVFQNGGKYNIFVQSIHNNCFNVSDNIKHSIYALPEIDIFLLSNNPICENSQAILFVKKDTLFSDNYVWSNGVRADTLFINESGYFYNFYISPDGCLSVSDSIFIQVNPNPQKPEIVQDKFRLICSTDAFRYIWYRNGNRISNSDSKVLFVDSLGSFKVRIFNQEGCWVDSENYLIDVISQESDLQFEFSPSPVSTSGRLEIFFQRESDLQFSIYDLTGRLIQQKKFSNLKNYFIEEIDFSYLSNGIYFMELNSNDKKKIIKIVKI